MPKTSGYWRTITPKKGVYIHIKITKKKGKRISKAKHLRRTKKRARITGKPRIERIRR